MTNTINALSVFVGDYYLLVPNTCIQELVATQNYKIKHIKEQYQFGVISWKQLNIPLVIINQNNKPQKQPTSHILIIKSLFNNNFNYYAFACYGIPKVLNISCDNINIAVKTNEQLAKYKLLIESMQVVIVDFKKIELLITSFYKDYKQNY